VAERHANTINALENLNGSTKSSQKSFEPTTNVLMSKIRRIHKSQKSHEQTIKVQMSGN